MNSNAAGFGLMMMLAGATCTQAADLDKMDGLQIYNKECSVCHGNMAQKTGAVTPVRPVQLAMATSEDGHEFAGVHLAVVPIYGPPLAGVIGRQAGTYEGYSYSSAFLQKMNGVVWDEAKLDAWIKSSQTVVPGSFMFYSQKKEDARAKVIEYLKKQGQ